MYVKPAQPEYLCDERVLYVAEVLPDHLLAQSLARDEEPRHGVRSVVEEPALNQVLDALLRLSAPPPQ